MVKALELRTALGKIEDLTTPSATQLYPLGYECVLEDTDYKTIKKFVYVQAATALTAYVPYTIDFTSVSAAEVTTKTPVAIAANGAQIGVSSVTVPTTTPFCFLQTMGDAKANCAATPTLGDALEVSAAAPTVFTTEGSSTVSVNSFAIYKDTATTAAAKVWLIGNQAIVVA